MTKPIQLTVNLPFPGFYHSEYSEAVDHEESSWLEYHADDNGETGEDYESSWPEPLSLANDLGDLLFRHTQYSVAYRKIAEWYVDAFDHAAGEVFEMTRPDKRKVWNVDYKSMRDETYQRPSIGMTFESMDSPREYNFTTDRVYGLVPLKVMRELFKRSKTEGHKTLAALIADRFTSYDGFSSFYSNDVDSWLEKAGRLQDWDHNELGTLLIAALQMAGADMESGDYYESFPGKVRELTIGDEGAYQAWESAVDWPAFDKARLEARAEKLVEWMESDADAAKAWMRENGERAAAMAAVEPAIEPDLESVTIRCPLTLDLFAPH